MRKCILILFLLISISSVIANFEKDMKYYSVPSYYSTYGWEKAYSCYFKLSYFGISGYDYKIKIIGIIGYVDNFPAYIYVTSKEELYKTEYDEFYVPICNPQNNWQGADYGPKRWHINNTYPNYDDCNVYSDKWHYSKDVDKFWCIYYEYEGITYPIFDCGSSEINSLTWYGGWYKGVGSGFENYNWCMHCVIVYWGASIENTSLGVVKALFK
jgi:hypothetical protein